MIEFFPFTEGASHRTVVRVPVYLKPVLSTLADQVSEFALALLNLDTRAQLHSQIFVKKSIAPSRFRTRIPV